MHGQVVIIHGPQGCGKSQNANRLRKRFACTSITDPWDGRSPLKPDTLALTNCEPPFRNAAGAMVLTYEQAIKGQA